MSLFRFTACVAPKVFVFKDPDTGHQFSGKSIPDLAVQVRSYRIQNELEELPYLEAVIESYLCKLPAHIGACEKLPKLKRGLMETIRGGVAIVKTMLYPSFASQEKADARAEICTTCPLNTFYDKGAFVKWCDEVAEDVVGDHRSKHHEALGVCSACSCGLRFKVFYNEEIHLTNRQRHTIEKANPKCWQLLKN